MFRMIPPSKRYVAECERAIASYYRRRRGLVAREGQLQDLQWLEERLHEAYKEIFGKRAYNKAYEAGFTEGHKAVIAEVAERWGLTRREQTSVDRIEMLLWRQ